MTGIKQDSLISLNDISVFEIFDKAEINISQWLPGGGLGYCTASQVSIIGMLWL